MRRLCHAHDVGSDLGIEMRGHGHAGSAANGGRAEPAGDATDAHKVRHYEIARLALQCLVQLFDTQLDRGYQLPSRPSWVLRDNKWRATRYGLDAVVITDDSGATAPLRDEVFELLRDLYRRADGGVFVKCTRHSLRQTNTTVRGGKGGHITLMHRVAAPEEHGIGHLRTVEMRA